METFAVDVVMVVAAVAVRKGASEASVVTGWTDVLMSAVMARVVVEVVMVEEKDSLVMVEAATKVVVKRVGLTAVMDLAAMAHGTWGIPHT